MPPLTNHMHEELASLTPILLVLFNLEWSFHDEDPAISQNLKKTIEQGLSKIGFRDNFPFSNTTLNMS